MNLIEINCPAAALTPQDRATFAEDIISGLVGSEVAGDAEVPEETMRRARAMTHIGFRELTDWTTGDGPWRPGQAAAPIWVTMTVPEGWREETARHLIGWIRRAVRRLDERRGWQRTGGDLWVNITGIADGSIGLNGKSTTADGVVSYMTEEFRAGVDAGRQLPDGVVVDPMCGMTVKLGPQAIILEHDGDTLGFCAEACRRAYAHEYGLAVPG